jgi:hypothetical protein
MSLIQSSAADIVFSSDVLSSILILILVSAGLLLRHVLGPEYNGRFQSFRRDVLVKFDPIARRLLERPLVTRKGTEEYVCTVEIQTDSLVDTLFRQGYILNPVSTLKVRGVDGRQESVFTMKFSIEDSERQLHAYGFRSVFGGGVDIYQHEEDDWNPAEGGCADCHLDASDQIAGDPDGILRDALDAESVEWSVYEFEDDT